MEMAGVVAGEGGGGLALRAWKMEGARVLHAYALDTHPDTHHLPGGFSKRRNGGKAFIPK
jgi:hypothetical protein